MATDPTDPTNPILPDAATVDASAESLKGLTNEVEKHTRALGLSTEAQKKELDATIKSAIALNDAKKANEDSIPTLMGYAAALGVGGLNSGILTKNTKELTAAFDSSGIGAGEASSKLEGLGLNVANLATGLIGMTSISDTVTKSFANLGEGSKTWIGDASAGLGTLVTFAKTISDHIPIAKNLVDTFGKYGGAAIAAADNTTKLEQSFIQMHAAAGTLNDVFTDEGDSLKDLDVKMKTFSDRSFEVAKATGIASEKIYGLMSGLSKIPNFADASSTALIDLTRVAATMPGGIVAAQSELLKLYENFNMGADKTEKGLEYISQISDVVNNYKGNFDQARGAVDSFAEKFALLGNNSEAALNILNSFAPALKETGLSAKQATDMFAAAADGISNMNTAQKGFMSARTGGPGGLQGAFKIDKLMKDGKADEVFKMAESSLRKQMGGHITTLDEASQSQGAAANYQRQLSIAKSGAFGGMVKNDTQAAKLFEAMKNGSVMDNKSAKQLLSGENALTQSKSRGSELQLRSMTEINQKAEDVKKLLMESNRYLADVVRGVIGAKAGSLMAGDIKGNINIAEENSRMGKGRISGSNPAFAALMDGFESAKKVIRSYKEAGHAGVPDQHPAAATAAPLTPAQAAAVNGPVAARAIINRMGAVSASDAGTASSAVPIRVLNKAGTASASAHTESTPKQPGHMHEAPTEMVLSGKIEMTCAHCGNPANATAAFNSKVGAYNKGNVQR